MTTPTLHILCAKLGLKGYDPSFLSKPLSLDLSDLNRTLVALIYGNDPGEGMIPYGFVSDGTDGPIAWIRGTEIPFGNFIEWEKDFEAVLDDCPIASGCKWHRGFGSIYLTLYVVGRGVESPLGLFLATLRNLTVSGHSLGGPLATYAAGAGNAKNLVLFASPRPGNSALAKWVKEQTSLYEGHSIASYANLNDIVPKVPLEAMGFESVIPPTELSPTSVTPAIPDDWAQSHHLPNYLRLLEAVP